VRGRRIYGVRVSPGWWEGCTRVGYTLILLFWEAGMGHIPSFSLFWEARMDHIPSFSLFWEARMGHSPSFSLFWEARTGSFSAFLPVLRG